MTYLQWFSRWIVTRVSGQKFRKAGEEKVKCISMRKDYVYNLLRDVFIKYEVSICGKYDEKSMVVFKRINNPVPGDVVIAYTSYFKKKPPSAKNCIGRLVRKFADNTYIETFEGKIVTWTNEKFVTIPEDDVTEFDRAEYLKSAYRRHKKFFDQDYFNKAGEE